MWQGMSFLRLNCTFSLMVLFRFSKMLPLLTTLSLAQQLTSSPIIELPVSRFPDPTCAYHVLHGSENGPRVTG